MIGRVMNLSKSFIARSSGMKTSVVRKDYFLHSKLSVCSFSSDIRRFGLGNPNMSQAVVHNGIVYISGQVDDTGIDAKAQTANILKKVDALLEEAGTDKSKLLTASIWLKDIGSDFQDMNGIWNTWLDANNKPVRATGKF